MKFRFEIKLILIFIFAITLSTFITSIFNGKIIQENFTQFCDTYNKELPRCLRDEAGQTFLKSVEEALWISGSVALTASIILSIIVTRFLLKPIRVIIQASKKFAAGNYQKRINLKTNDEFNELINEINNLFEKVENQVKLRKDLVANFSHEISTPLTSLYGYIEAFKDKVINSKQDSKKILKIMKSEVEQVIKLSQETRELAVLESDNFEINLIKINLKNLIEEIILSLQPIAKKHKINLNNNLTKVINIKADKLKLKQALMNIINNAILYSKPNQQVNISAQEDKTKVAIQIQDYGIGMNLTTCQNIFERFYRSNGARNKCPGAGIGLAITKKIIDLHHGKIEVQSQLNHGSLFTIILPKNIN